MPTHIEWIAAPKDIQMGALTSDDDVHTNWYFGEVAKRLERAEAGGYVAEGLELIGLELETSIR